MLRNSLLQTFIKVKYIGNLDISSAQAVNKCLALYHWCPNLVRVQVTPNSDEFQASIATIVEQAPAAVLVEEHWEHRPMLQPVYTPLYLYTLAAQR